MPETLKAGGEQSAGDLEKANHLEVLTEMSDSFDPEKAKNLALEDQPKEAVEPSTKLELLSKKPVEELTPKEASKEYLDLLMDLSADFTSAEGKSSRVASYDENGNLVIHNNGYSGENRRIVGQLLETATGKNFQEEKYKLENGKWEDEYVDRELALAMADDIITAESDWRLVADSTSIEDEQAEKEALIQEKDKAKKKLSRIERGPFGGLKKGLYRGLRKEKYDELYATANREPRTKAENSAYDANAKLQRALETAYSKDYGYGHHRLDDERTRRDGVYADQVNGEFNETFFAKEKQEKIDRAVEIRRKLEADQIIKR